MQTLQPELDDLLDSNRRHLRSDVYGSVIGGADTACSELEFLPERRLTGYEATTYMELYSVEKELAALWYAGRRGVRGLVLIPLDPVDKLLHLDFHEMNDFGLRWRVRRVP